MTIPTITVAQIRAGITDAQSLQTAIDTLESLGFPATAWEDEDLNRALLEFIVKNEVNFAAYCAALARQNTLATNDDEAVERFGRNFFSEAKRAAIAAQHQVTFSCTAGEGPHSPGIGEVTVGDGTSNFQNIAPITIPDGGSVTATVEALIPGSIANSAINTITEMVTSLDGVTVDNPAISGSTNSLIRSGRDKETSRVYRPRMRGKFPRLSAETTQARAEAIALEAAGDVTKVRIDATNPRGAGTVDIWIAGDSATAAAGDVTAVQAAINASCFGADQPDLIGGDPRVWVRAATTVDLDIVSTVYYLPTFSATAIETAVLAQLADLIDETPLGGVDYSPSLQNKVLTQAIRTQMSQVDGVEAVILTTPSTDIDLTISQLLVEGDWSAITYTAMPA